MSLRKLKRQAMRQQMKSNEQLRQEYEASRKALGSEKTIAGLLQNGITPEQLREEFDRGYRTGYYEAGMPMSRAAMAAAILALKEVFGFGEKRCIKFLNVMFDKLCTALTHEELIQEAFDKVNVQIDLGDPVEGVKQK